MYCTYPHDQHEYVSKAEYLLHVKIIGYEGISDHL